MAEPIDISKISDEEFLRLTGQLPAPAPAQAVKPQAAGDGSFDLSQLSDDQFAKMFGGAPKQPEMGNTEAAARLFYKHLTFGTEPGVDKKKSEQASAEHPYIDVAAAIPAFAAQTAVLGPLATAGKAVQGAGMLARTSRALGTAAEVGLLPNTNAKTFVEAARTGAKLGGNYSGLEALGSGLTNPEKSGGEVAKDVALSYGLGTTLGGGLGGAAHGVSRGVGALANRTVPQLREALEAAKSPEAQGVRDIIKHAGYDNADLAALKANIDKAATDPRLAARYEDLNVLEALKAGKLKPTATGELKPEVITTRNLDDLAKHAANTEGRGQNIAAEAFGTRKNEMSAKMQGDIDKFFGTTDREADAATLAAKREAVSKRYNKLREEGNLVTVEELGNMQKLSPVFDKALRYAGENDAIANPGSPWAKLWSGGQLGKDVVTLSPSNMLDIHHYLVLNAKPSVGRDPAEALMASRLKSWFTDWADKNFSKHKALREDYAQLRRVMDATEKGAELPTALGGKDHESLAFLRQQTAALKKAEDLLTRKATAYALAAQNGQSPASLNAFKGNMQKAQKIVERQREVIDEFIKARGDSMKQFLRERGDNGPAQLTKALTTEEGKARLLEQLGKDRGTAYIESLYNKANQQKLGNTLYGGSDTAFKTQKRESRDALWRMATGLAHLRPSEVWRGAGDMLSSGYRQRNADRINELLSQQGPPAVSNILGSALATQSLQSTAHPFVRNPLLKALPFSSGVADPGLSARVKKREP